MKNSEAVQRSKEQKVQIEKMLKALNKAVKNYGKNQSVNWGHVGTLAYVQESVANVCQVMNAKF